MKCFALVAVLLAVLCVAPFAVRAEDPPEPTFYVQVAFESCLNGDTDAEALAAWNAFVVEANKIQNCVGTFRERIKKAENHSFVGALNQPRLTAAQIATLTVEAGKLINSPCFNKPLFAIRLSNAPMEIKPLIKPKISIPRSQWDQ